VTETFVPGSAADLARFAELQAGLPRLFRSVFSDRLAPRTVVVVPGLSLDVDQLARIAGTLHYEERHLSLLLLLKMPNTRLVYVTSQPLHPLIVDYYLNMLPGVPSAHARRRLTLLSACDGSLASLTRKILDRPRLLQRLREAIGDPAIAHLSVFNSTPLERTLAVRLGVPLYACDPALKNLGSKSGSRRIFRAAGIRFPDGAEDLRDARDVADALVGLKLRQPTLARAAVKLDEGFSGEGNAVFSFEGAPDSGAPGLRDWIDEHLPRALRFEARDEYWEHFCHQLQEKRGIVEAWVEGAGHHSPSAQFRVNPLGDIESVSTHDQVLGGPSGQTFLGSTFPASAAYRREIHEAGLKVAEQLRQRGVIGRFAVDFVVPGDSTHVTPCAIEINLRKGGTAFPFQMLQLLTDGRYDPNDGLFCTRSGEPRCYYATDNLQKDAYRRLTPEDVVEVSVEADLHFDEATQQGTTFSLLGCVAGHGKLGVTAIGKSAEDAARLYRRVVTTLDEAAR
jgi:hypothetical protein